MQEFASLRGFSGGAEYCFFVRFQHTEPVFDVCGVVGAELVLEGVLGLEAGLLGIFAVFCYFFCCFFRHLFGFSELFGGHKACCFITVFF